MSWWAWRLDLLPVCSRANPEARHVRLVWLFRPENREAGLKGTVWFGRDTKTRCDRHRGNNLSSGVRMSACMRNRSLED